MLMRHVFIFFSLLFSLTACSGADFLNFFTPEDGYSVRKDIAYGKLPRQKLDVYLPLKMNESATVVVFFYGGAWQAGSKNDYLFIAESLTSMGYITVIPDYRLYPEVKYPAFIEDAAQATVWVHENIAKMKGSTEKIYVMGHSAGAYNAIMISLSKKYMEQAGGQADWIKGAIGLAGPYSFLPIRESDIQAIFSSEKDLPKTQPITYARAGAPRIFLATGTADSTVYPRNSYRLYGELQELGNDVTYKEYDGVGHIPLLLELTKSFSNKQVLREDIAAFIAKDQRPAKPALSQ